MYKNTIIDGSTHISSNMQPTYNHNGCICDIDVVVTARAVDGHVGGEKPIVVVVIFIIGIHVSTHKCLENHCGGRWQHQICQIEDVVEIFMLQFFEFISVGIVIFIEKTTEKYQRYGYWRQCAYQQSRHLCTCITKVWSLMLVNE